MVHLFLSGVTMPAVESTAKTPTSATVVTSSNTGTNAPGSTSGASKRSGKPETAVAGLKRKKLHSDNAGGDAPLLRKVRNETTYMYTNK